jgi:AraC-like DNA-binding protein
MSLDQTDLLLQRSPVVHTTHPTETGFAIPDPEGFSGIGNYVQLNDIGLGFCGYGARTVVSFPESDFARLQIGLVGCARTTFDGEPVTVNDREFCITSPGQAATLDFRAGYQQLVLRIKASALERALTSLLGVRPRGRLAFDTAARADDAGSLALRRLVQFLAEQLDHEAIELPQPVLLELEQAITMSFLYSTRHSFSPLLEREAPNTTARPVRMAEEYIESCWDRPIMIEDLSAHTNLSARALFKAFRKARGYSPMAFAKSVRLKRARAMLSDGNPEHSVTATASACGFGNLGHFAKDYRKAFGERPSETLARARDVA